MLFWTVGASLSSQCDDCICVLACSTGLSVRSERVCSGKNLSDPMVRRPVVASMLSLVGGVVVVLLVSTFALHSFLFLPGVISGIIVILSGVMLYERPNGHSLWSGLVIAVAVVDLLGVMFFLSAPAPQARSSDTNRVGGAST